MLRRIGFDGSAGRVGSEAGGQAGRPGLGFFARWWSVMLIKCCVPGPGPITYLGTYCVFEPGRLVGPCAAPRLMDLSKFERGRVVMLVGCAGK